MAASWVAACWVEGLPLHAFDNLLFVGRVVVTTFLTVFGITKIGTFQELIEGLMCPAFNSSSTS